MFYFWKASILLLGGACSSETLSDPIDEYLDLPTHFPPFAPSQQLTLETIELGRLLFYDTRLSVDGSRSCGVCHEQSKAFTDGLIRGLGVDNTPLPLNSLSLVNIAWREELTWNQQIVDIAEHMQTPLFGSNPIEMGMNETLLQSRLQESEVYHSLFANAFPDQETPITATNTVRAIADFTLTMVSGNSPYDRWILGEDSLDSKALQGMDLFFGEALRCSACHAGLFFDQPDPLQVQEDTRHGYFNTGQYNIDEDGRYPDSAQGLIQVTGNPEDMGKFRTPTLRNLAYTYPWMHDGTETSLRNILNSYARGGRLLESGPNPGDGRLNPYKSDLIGGFSLTDSEVDALIAFLESLNDDQLLTLERLQSPFCMERQGVVINAPCEPGFLPD